jgi:hypothetical protein
MTYELPATESIEDLKDFLRKTKDGEHGQEAADAFFEIAV